VAREGVTIDEGRGRWQGRRGGEGWRCGEGRVGLVRENGREEGGVARKGRRGRGCDWTGQLG
jgi:hypothetical protein